MQSDSSYSHACASARYVCIETNSYRVLKKIPEKYGKNLLFLKQFQCLNMPRIILFFISYI